jgi:hypothetical protein
MALESTRPLTEISTRNILGGKGRPGRENDNLTTIYEPIVSILDVSQPYGPSRPVTGITLPFLAPYQFTVYDKFTWLR